MLQQYSIFTRFTEHINVLALLYLIGHIIDHRFFRFLILGSFRSFLLCLLLFSCFCFFFFIFLNAVFQGKIFAIQILKEDIIVHLLTKFRILDASKFDKRADIIPVLLIRLSVCLAHSGELICYFLGDVFRNLFHKTIILQCRTGNIQRKIRAVDHTFQKKKEFRDHLFDVICNKYLIIIKLDGSLNGIILCPDLREIQDTLQIERVVHVQMDPEQRLLIIHKYLTVKFFILFIRALIWVFHPERLCIA